MIKLEECPGKNIRVKLDDKTELTGYVSHFCIGEDFEYEYDSLIIQVESIPNNPNKNKLIQIGEIFEVFEDEIKEIEILD